MISSTIVGTVLVLAALAIIPKLRSNSDLDKIPNAHFTAPYSKLWILIVRWRAKEHRTRTQLHQRLGPIVRLGPREVSVNCVDEGIRLIYNGKFDKEKTYYSALTDEVVVMFTMLGNEEHKRRRRMLSHVYSKTYVQSSQALDNILSTVLAQFKEKLNGWADTRTSVDIFVQNKECALDITSGWLYGLDKKTDTLRHPGLEQDFSILIDSMFSVFFMQANFQWLVKLLTTLGISKPPKPVLQAVERWKAWVTETNSNENGAQEARHAHAATPSDILSQSLRAANPEMSDHEISSHAAAECDDQLAASHQGLGISLTYAMYELTQRPAIQSALRKEVLTLAEPSERSLTQRIDDLPLLDAVVTETLRLRAPGPGPFPRVVADGGCRLAGRFNVPAGTVVGTSVWALHRDASVFPDPERWRPERWIESDEKSIAEMRRWFWAFGSGPRMCVGAHFATRVFKEVLVAVYTDFETLPDENFDGNVDQVDHVMAGPVAARLNLRFRRAG